MDRSSLRPPRVPARRKYAFCALLGIAFTICLAVARFSRRDTVLGKRGLLLVNTSKCQGFAELRQTVLLALVAARRADRCLVLPGLTEGPAGAAEGQSPQQYPFSEALLGACARKMQACLIKPTDELLAAASPPVEGFEMLLQDSAKQLRWDCSSISLPPNAHEHEEVFWKAAGCVDAATSPMLQKAAKLLSAALHSPYHMILGASDLTSARSHPKCQGPHCETVLDASNLAEHLTQKGFLPDGAQLVIADDVDAASEGE